VSRYERRGTYAGAGDLLDLLRVDGGQLTVAQLLSERALAAAEIARLREQVESLTRGVGARPNGGRDPDRAQPRRESPRAAGAGATRSQQQLAPNRAEPFPPNALLRLKDVGRLVGLSRTTIYKRMSDGTFPLPLRVSERSVRWRMQDLQEWTAGLAKK
jgi:prophage regulatory protein